MCWLLNMAGVIYCSYGSQVCCKKTAKKHLHFTNKKGAIFNTTGTVVQGNTVHVKQTMDAAEITGDYQTDLPDLQ